MRRDNPFREIVDEAARRATGNRDGLPSARARTAGSGVPGTGVPDVLNSVNLNPSGYFRIGVSAIGGPDGIA